MNIYFFLFFSLGEESTETGSHIVQIGLALPCSKAYLELLPLSVMYWGYRHIPYACPICIFFICTRALFLFFLCPQLWTLGFAQRWQWTSVSTVTKNLFTLRIIPRALFVLIGSWSAIELHVQPLTWMSVPPSLPPFLPVYLCVQVMHLCIQFQVHVCADQRTASCVCHAGHFSLAVHLAFWNEVSCCLRTH